MLIEAGKAYAKGLCSIYSRLFESLLLQAALGWELWLVSSTYCWARGAFLVSTDKFCSSLSRKGPGPHEIKVCIGSARVSLTSK